MSVTAKDITNKRFGKLKIIRRSGSNRDGSVWLCLCDCGKKKRLAASQLRKKYKPVKSCGCGSSETRFKIDDITGKKFKRLTVISYAYTKNHNTFWKCRCDCGHVKVYGRNKLKERSYCKKCLVKDEIYWITKWVKRNLLRKGEKFKGREKLNVEDIVKLALIGKERFPYMRFSEGMGNIDKSTQASLDRIDPNKDYSDSTNIQVIPFWLNAAKMNQSEAQLKSYMIHYLNHVKPQ